MEEKNGLPFISWVQSCIGKSWMTIFFAFFCHICRTTICWPWQRDITTSPLCWTTGFKQDKRRNLIIIFLFSLLIYLFIRREKLWKDNSYISLNAALDEEEEDEDNENKDLFDEEEENDQKDIQYVRGDVTHPINTRGRDAIIVHCVGMWRHILNWQYGKAF